MIDGFPRGFGESESASAIQLGREVSVPRTVFQSCFIIFYVIFLELYLLKPNIARHDSISNTAYTDSYR